MIVAPFLIQQDLGAGPDEAEECEQFVHLVFPLSVLVIVFLDHSLAWF